MVMSGLVEHGEKSMIYQIVELTTPEVAIALDRSRNAALNFTLQRI